MPLKISSLFNPAVFFFLVFALYTNNVIAQYTGKLILPQEGLNSELEIIHFSWNKFSSTDLNYHLEVSNNNQFSALSLDTFGIDNPEFVYNFSESGTFYWRVRANNNVGYTPWSETRTFFIFSPGNLSGIEAWYRADTGITLMDSLVMQWNDQSEMLNHASNTDPFNPVWMDSISLLNGYPAIRFDGQNDYLEFAEINTIRSVAMVLKHRTGIQEAAPILGHPDSYDFHGGYAWAEDKILMEVTSSPSLVNGLGFLNSTSMNPADIPKTTDYSALIFVTISPVTASYITKDRFYTERVWDGDFAEIIISNQNWTAEEVEQVENYLYSKYAPPVTLGPDITVEYGFCPTIISAEERFKNYLWSTGDTIPSITVGKSGSFWVQTTDVFDRISTDTISIYYPGDFLSSFTLCSNQDSIWSTGLSNDYYSFLWQDNSADSSIIINSGGDYYVSVTDTMGCAVNSDTIVVAIDFFDTLVYLGPDTSLCSGNYITLQNGGGEAISYLWNDGSNEEELEILNSGIYWLEVQNEIGCIGRDTIEVTVLGEAPTAGFTYSNTCFAENVLFQDISEPPDGETIAQFSWDFGDSNSSIEADPIHMYDSLGIYEVSITVTTDAGCSDSFKDSVKIHPLPEANFTFQNLCHEQTAIFTDNSSLIEGTIENWDWTFGTMGTGNGEIAIFVFPNPGAVEVSLMVESTEGCTDELSLTLTVNGSPITNFETNSVCFGEPLLFNAMIDESLSGPTASYFWEFGDGQSSIFPSTSHTYFIPGSYNAQLTATSIFGCSDDTTLSVGVFDNPTAAFIYDTLCVNRLTDFIDNSQIYLTDNLAAWNWTFSDGQMKTGSEIEVSFANTGVYTAHLEVMSETGCSDDISQNITVYDNPIAEFDFDPVIGLPPLETEFFNESVEGSSYMWFFGDGGLSSEFEPIYTYLDTGIFDITLEVENEVGCKSSVSHQILVIEPIFDVAITALECETVEGFIYLSAQIFNLGNHDIFSLDLNTYIGNGSNTLEHWQGELKPGDNMNYPLTTGLAYNANNQFPFVCLEISNPNGDNRELTEENNYRCKALKNENELITVFPNPSNSILNLAIISPNASKAEISIYDSSGKIVIELSGINIAQGYNEKMVDVSRLGEGSYIIRATWNNQDHELSFIIER